MEQKSLEFENFINQKIAPCINGLESRRAKFKALFHRTLAISVITIVVLSLYILMNWGKIDDPNGAFQTFAILTYFAAFVAPYVVLLKYRRNTIRIHYLEFTRSIKEEIFSDILDFFGKFTFSNTKSISLYDLQSSLLLPESEEYLYEDHIEGITQDTKVEIAEIKLVSKHHGKRVALFNGLIIMLDICNSDIKLRGPFNGKTVIIQDNAKNLAYTKEKYKGFERVNLPTPDLEEQFEVLSTNPSEAAKIIDERLLLAILSISQSIANSKEQILHKDASISFLVGAYRTIAIFLGQIIYTSVYLVFAGIPLAIRNLIRGEATGFSNPFRDGTIELEVFDPTKHVELFKGDSSELHAINNSIQCSFFNDKILITIPHEKDLFEPNSLFEPPLVQEDAVLLFHIMKTIGTINNIICENKKG